MTALGDFNARSGQRLNLQTKAEAVYVEVRRLILEGILEPGATLSQEALATRLGISVTPLREGLRRLESDGLIELRAHRTMAVPLLTRTDLHDLYAVRRQLDPFAAGAAAKNATDEQIAAIVAAVTVRTAPGLHTELVANRAFHRAIYTAAGNRVLTDILDRLWNRSDRYRLIVLRDHVSQSTALREHAEIAAAIQSRDARRGARLMDAHVQGTLRMVEGLGYGLQ
jgi:DNA-binding GntR family transcriptional regulator